MGKRIHIFPYTPNSVVSQCLAGRLGPRDAFSLLNRLLPERPKPISFITFEYGHAMQAYENAQQLLAGPFGQLAAPYIDDILTSDPSAVVQYGQLNFDKKWLSQDEFTAWHAAFDREIDNTAQFICQHPQAAVKQIADRDDWGPIEKFYSWRRLNQIVKIHSQDSDVRARAEKFLTKAHEANADALGPALEKASIARNGDLLVTTDVPKTCVKTLAVLDQAYLGLLEKHHRLDVPEKNQMKI